MTPAIAVRSEDVPKTQQRNDGRHGEDSGANLRLQSAAGGLDRFRRAIPRRDTCGEPSRGGALVGRSFLGAIQHSTRDHRPMTARSKRNTKSGLRPKGQDEAETGNQITPREIEDVED